MDKQKGELYKRGYWTYKRLSKALLEVIQFEETRCLTEELEQEEKKE